MLMAEITESLDDFLTRIVRKLIPRLLVISGELPAEEAEVDLRTADDEADPLAADEVEGVLMHLRMAVRLRDAVDSRIRYMVVTGTASGEELLLDELLGASPSQRATWKELGEALGVSAQAAHRKYGQAARMHQASSRDDLPAASRDSTIAWPSAPSLELP